MDFSDLLDEDGIVLSLPARNKTALLRGLSERAAERLRPLGAHAIEAALAAREGLGATGLGDGFALPHARIDGIDRFFGLLARLAQPIDYQAIDGKPVDVVFLLLMPTDQASRHIEALAVVARWFRAPARLAVVRRAGSVGELFARVRSGG